MPPPPLRSALATNKSNIVTIDNAFRAWGGLIVAGACVGAVWGTAHDVQFRIRVNWEESPREPNIMDRVVGGIGGILVGTVIVGYIPVAVALSPFMALGSAIGKWSSGSK